MQRSFRGFTLIELLIVVAIIAVLAAIAVPNFLEAQTRSKVSRVKADMRSLATALECYCVDNNRYPDQPESSRDQQWQGKLTTPVAYLSTTYADVFARRDEPRNASFQYSHCAMMKSWMFTSVGADQTDNFEEDEWMCGMAMTYPMPYDPTNGTVSAGDIRCICRQGGADLMPMSCCVDDPND